MLNHATMRVNESERERTLGEAEHRRTSLRYQEAEQRVHHLQKELKRAIAKSRYLLVHVCSPSSVALYAVNLILE
jgi:SH3-domain binding protein 5